MKLVKEGKAIPLCPEQLGGLATPRNPAYRNGDKILTKNGKDVTKNFLKGANEGLKLATLVNCKIAILKANSPSCDSVNGVFADLLKRNGIEVYSEKDLEKEEIYDKIRNF
jgi:uncharacterized protein YbbK (DUF523 family)